METESRKGILKICMSKGFLLDKEMLDLLSGLNAEGAKEIIDTLSGLDIKERMISKNFFAQHFEKIIIPHLKEKLKMEK